MGHIHPVLLQREFHGEEGGGSQKEKQAGSDKGLSLYRSQLRHNLNLAAKKASVP
jgi:hypothetical protein